MRLPARATTSSCSPPRGRRCRWLERARARRAGRDRGRLRGVRRARRPGPAVPRRAGRLVPEVDRAAVLRPHPGQGRRSPVTVSPDRLHRRPRLRADGPADRRGRRSSTRSSRPGAATGMRPFGEEALMMLRIEAGLPLIGVEWHDSRTPAPTPSGSPRRSSGMGWMLRASATAAGAFVGREAIRRELVEGTSRWATIGIVVDWADWDRLHRDAGAAPGQGRAAARPGRRCCATTRTARASRSATSPASCYSPVLQRHIGLARVRPELAAAGTELHMEPTVHHDTHTVAVGHRAAALLQPRAEDGQMTETSPGAPAAPHVVRRDRRRRRPQRPHQRGVPRQGGAAHARSGAAPRWWVARPSPRSCARASRSRRSPTR